MRPCPNSVDFCRFLNRALHAFGAWREHKGRARMPPGRVGVPATSFSGMVSVIFCNPPRGSYEGQRNPGVAGWLAPTIFNALFQDAALFRVPDHCRPDATLH